MFTRRRAKSIDAALPQRPLPPTGNVKPVPPLLADAANEAARQEFEAQVPGATATVPPEHVARWYTPPSQRVSRAT